MALAKLRGARSEHIAIYESQQIIGLADVRIKQIPLLGSGLAFISGGPMTRLGNENDLSRLHSCLQALSQEYSVRQGLVLRLFLPPGPEEWMQGARTTFESLGFQLTTKSPIYRTILLNIDRSDEEIRKTFLQKWRNGLNQAQRHGLTLRTGTQAELMAEFRDLYREFIQKKGFQCDLDADFYYELQCRCEEVERQWIALADFEGQMVAGHVSSLLGDTCVYLLGASTDVGLTKNASYLLQWNAIVTARERGLKWYDLGGIDPEAAEGVYKFKRGLGGSDIISPGPYEFTPPGVRSRLALKLEEIYRKARR